MLASLTLLAACPLLVAPLQDPILPPSRVWAPESRIVRQLSAEFELEPVLRRFGGDGQEFEFPESGDAQVRRLEARIADRVLESEAGRLERLERAFSELGQELEGALEEDAWRAADSDLNERRVEFRPDGEEGYLAEYAEQDEDGARELLEGLNFDLDLRFLLPPAGVRPGDSWDVDPALFPALAQPAGDLGFGRLEAEGRTDPLPDKVPAEMGYSQSKQHELGLQLAGRAAWDMADGSLVELTLAGEQEVVETTLTVVRKLSESNSMAIVSSGPWAPELRVE
jgi:hypothetical protein